MEKTYGEFLKYIEAGKNKEDRPIDNNTRVIKQEHYIAIKLHNTEIIKYFPDGRIRLNSGGWLTITTRDRMNKYSPIQVYTNKRVWYATFNDKTYLYQDNMTFDTRNGDVINSEFILAKEFNPNQVKQKEKELKAITNYSKKFVSEFLAGKIPTPNQGDCFYCQFQLTGNPPCSTAKLVDGALEVTPGVNSDHIKSHIKSNYYVPSLFANALKETPHLSQYDKYVIHGIWNEGRNMESNGSLVGLTNRNLVSTLSRYIRKQLGYQLS